MQENLKAKYGITTEILQKAVDKINHREIFAACGGNVFLALEDLIKHGDIAGTAKPETDEITIKLNGGEWAILLNILKQKSEEVEEQMKVRFEFADDKYNKDRYAYFSDLNKTITEIALQIKTKVGIR